MRNKETRLAARQGTMTPVWPDKLARISAVDRGVRVMAVSIPAQPPQKVSDNRVMQTSLHVSIEFKHANTGCDKVCLLNGVSGQLKHCMPHAMENMVSAI